MYELATGKFTVDGRVVIGIRKQPSAIKSVALILMIVLAANEALESIVNHHLWLGFGLERRLDNGLRRRPHCVSTDESSGINIPAREQSYCYNNQLAAINDTSKSLQSADDNDCALVPDEGSTPVHLNLWAALSCWWPKLSLLPLGAGSLNPSGHFRLFGPIFPAVGAIRVVRLDAPDTIESGQVLRLRCVYETRNDKLQSLSWYKNGREFYRYQPFERRNSVLTFNLTGIHVDVPKSKNGTVYLNNTSVETSGRYKCEATATNFQEVNMETYVTVVTEMVKSGSISLFGSRLLNILAFTFSLITSALILIATK